MQGLIICASRPAKKSATVLKNFTEIRPGPLEESDSKLMKRHGTCAHASALR